MIARDPDNGQLVDAENYWTDAFEGFLSEQASLAETANRNHPCPITACRTSALKMVLDAFRWHKSKAKRKEAPHNPSCITDPRSHFDLLVTFIEEVKQDSSQGIGLAHEASFETCKAILGYADHIRKYRKQS